MNETTDIQWIIAFVCIMAIIATTSVVVHRIKRARRISHNDYLLHRRCDMKLGDMDVE